MSQRLQVSEISLEAMTSFVTEHHYSTVMPRQTKACYGGFRDESLRAAISFGWGSKPLHTIQKIFPSLDTQDYLEIGKMCVHDDEPRNTETQFMKDAFYHLRRRLPNLKLIFTWADGIWGKPGYVYQASNFLYGGSDWTEVYQMDDGRRLHPLQLKSLYAERGIKTELRTQRPTFDELTYIGWKHFEGKLFRYVRFLCDRKEEKRLRLDSAVAGFTWSTRYPKHGDLEWRVQIAEGKYASCAQPKFTGTYERRQHGKAAKVAREAS